MSTPRPSAETAPIGQDLGSSSPGPAEGPTGSASYETPSSHPDVATTGDIRPNGSPRTRRSSINVSQQWLSCIAAVASAVAAFFAAWAAWEAVDLSRLRYKDEIKSISISLNRLTLDDWDIQIRQLTGPSFDLKTVFVKPMFLHTTSNKMTEGHELPMDAEVVSQSSTSSGSYPTYQIRNIKNNVCRSDICEEQSIAELVVRYFIYDREKTEIVK